MAEWLKAAVLKTANRKVRGFESYSLRHFILNNINKIVNKYPLKMCPCSVRGMFPGGSFFTLMLFLLTIMAKKEEKEFSPTRVVEGEFLNSLLER